MQTYKVMFNYVSPLLFKSTRGINPLDPLVKESKSITSKHHSKKTDSDLERLMEIDYELSAYYDDEIGMFVPADVLEACIREGAKANRNGAKAKIAVFVSEDRVPLKHDGPKDLKELYKLDKFRDIRPVTVNNAKVLRCRPRFERWSLEFHVELNEELMQPSELFQAIEIAGTQKGIGDYRPRYGRFVASIEQIA